MSDYSRQEIAKLQDNLSFIRKAGGWTTEEFGELIGVTKQTISNLENQKSPMSKTQYIAIRAVLDYEVTEQKDNPALASAVNICLNSENLSADDIKKAQAFVIGASERGLDQDTISQGLASLIGIAVAEAFGLLVPAILGTTSAWLSKLLKNKK